MNIGRIIQAECVNTAPLPDPRCDDEAFRIQNPGACPVHPTLIIKPGTALVCSLKSIQFRAFYAANGVETDVTDDCIWTSSDLNIVLIGVRSGNATGLSIGSVTISATYNDILTQADLTVLGDDCCDDRSVGMMLVIDNSRSMSQTFAGAYATRLTFAKAAATRFIDEVNFVKDTVGLIRVNDAENVVLSVLTDSVSTVSGLVPTIPQSQQKTSFYDALSAAIDELESADLKVIVLFSDGEDSVNTSYTDATNPIALLNDFKQQGGIVICMGARASGKGFQFLSAMATGGFFINAFPSNVEVALDYLSGIKGYICAGNCTPEGDVIQGKGELNYDEFLNWDVIGGTVDLQGLGFFDYIPGNGLYVDMAGTNPSQKGKLQLKTALSLTEGHVYGLTTYLAGNQLVSAAESVRIRLFAIDTNDDELEFISQLVTLSDYTQPFQPYTFNFTAPYDVDVFISIQLEEIPDYLDPRLGPFLGQVTFVDTTDTILMLDDDFDDENQTYVPPRCGLGTTYTYIPELGDYGYATGYSCYGTGCLDEPPIAQIPDPSPLPDIESGFKAPKVYTSTKQACASCEEGFINTADDAQSVCKSATATSTLSQSAADAAAYTAALDLARAELTCVRQYTSTQQYTAQCTTGSGPDVTKSSTKTSLISQDDADALALADAQEQAEAELDCSQSTNDRQIIINDPILGGGARRASPYPTHYFNLNSGTVTKVRLQLIDFTHDNPGDVHILIVGPTGIECEVLAGAGDQPISNIDIVFDQDAGAPLPASGALTSGDWQPSVYASQNYPLPAPTGPYSMDLNVFNGSPAHGSWAVYVMDVTHLNAGTIAGWSIEIQT